MKLLFLMISLYFSINVFAETLSLDSKLVIDGVTTNVTIAANEVEVDSPEIVRFEHLRGYIDGVKLPLLGISGSWCRFFGYKFLESSSKGIYEYDYQQNKEGISINENLQKSVILNSVNNHINSIQCTNNPDLSY